jgi:uncharacterized protein involved in response to NO
MRPLPEGIAAVPLFSYGFRPFFLAGALWAAFAMALWIGAVTGQWTIAADYGPVAWHAHELLFGYVSAAVTGFLLTAIPNWTGRLPVRGGPLMALLLLWLAGRVALLASDRIGTVPAAAIDSLFLVALAFIVAREIVAGRNWRNLKMVGLVSGLALANIGFHVETIVAGAPSYTLRAAIALVIGLIMVVGGRIVPSFTRNWLANRGAKHLPVPFGPTDMLLIILAAIALGAWVIAPESAVAGGLLLLAAVAQLFRLSRWAGLSTWRQPLVFVLHCGYSFVPLGFLLVGISVLSPNLLPPTDALHAWTAGAVALMTLAVMTRATLGHTGRTLTAGAGICATYLAAGVAVLARLAVPVLPEMTMPLLDLAALAWIAAFAAFAVVCGPMLTGPRHA